MRELNRLGVTGVIDAGGGSQNWPDDYRVIQDLEAAGELTVRCAYNLFTLEEVVRILAQNRWPWRLHATYDEAISRALDVFERVRMITGRTVGGLQLTAQRDCLDRETALRMWTENVTRFSNEEGRKGRIEVGQLADLAVPDRDFFACPEAGIADTSAVLTVVGGRDAGLVAGAPLRRLRRLGRRRRPAAAVGVEARGGELRLRRAVRRARPPPRQRLGGRRAGRRCARLLGRAGLRVLGGLTAIDAGAVEACPQRRLA